MELLYTAHVPAGAGPHPTIVAIHGWGASAHDLIGLAPILHRGQALVLCPQGPLAFPAGSGVPGYGWFPLAPDRAPDPALLEEARAGLERFVDAACAHYPVDPKRLIVAGFSQGGFMASLLALNDPARYAGLMMLSSWLPREVAARITPQPAHAELPALVIHGSDDPMVPVERAYEGRDALLALKVPTVFREYAMGHEIRPEALREIVDWLEAKVLSPLLV